jgi:hypothetical protein
MRWRQLLSESGGGRFWFIRTCLQLLPAAATAIGQRTVLRLPELHRPMLRLHMQLCADSETVTS